MKNKLMAAAAILTVMSVSGVAMADSATDVKVLKAQAAALKKQNAALEKRLNKVEQKQTAQARPGAQPASTDFMGMVTKGPLEAITDDGPICWKGICAFGTFDVGAGWASHGAPVNDHLYVGNTTVNPANRGSYFGVAPNGLSQTTVGIKGSQELLPGLAGIFYASTGINPQSGALPNAPQSLLDNASAAKGQGSLQNDGTRGGQAFNDELYAGVSSKEFGQLTFGRQKSLSLETMAAYDPAGYSYNYSIIGYSGSPVAGGGVTDDGRLDNTLKYKVVYGPVHFSALYKFVDQSAGYGTLCAGGLATSYCKPDNDGYQFNLGGSVGALNIDAVAGHFNQTVTYGVAPTGLVAKAYDTTDAMIGANYTMNQFKLFAGYAYDLLHNPEDQVGAGASSGQGGFTANTAAVALANNAKVLQTAWTGVKYAYAPNLDFTLSYYHEVQNDFATAGNRASCSNTIQNSRNANCAGTLDMVSFYGDYHFNKRFDVYAGMTYTDVGGGMASGYVFGRATDWAPTAGVRYKF